MAKFIFVFALFFFWEGAPLPVFASDLPDEESPEHSRLTREHQSLETFLRKFEGSVEESLWPFFKLSWSCLFKGYEKKLAQVGSGSPRRLSPAEEESHTNCLLTDLKHVKGDPSLQFLMIITRLNHPAHLEYLKQDPFFTAEKIHYLENFHQEFLSIKEDHDLFALKSFQSLTYVEGEKKTHLIHRSE